MRARRAALPRARKPGNLDPHTFEPQLLPLVVAGQRGEIVDPSEDGRRRAAHGLVTRCEDEIADRSFECYDRRKRSLSMVDRVVRDLALPDAAISEEERRRHREGRYDEG